MSNCEEIQVVGDNFGGIAKPLTSVKVKIFYEPGDGMHKNNIEATE